MTDQLDLSLLMDEEREAYSVAAHEAEWAAYALVRALIAARAENKRLVNVETVARGMLSSIDAILNAKSAGDVDVGNSHLLMAADKLRSLLQPKKGGAE